MAATTSQEKLNGGPEVESHNKQESDTGAAIKYFLLTMKYFSGREIIFSLRSDISPRMKTNLICGLYIFSGASVIDIMRHCASLLCTIACVKFSTDSWFKADLIFLCSAEKSASTKDEAIEARVGEGHFVRAYKDRTGRGVASSSGVRMSVAIRPQTVANLASKFDSIIGQEKPGQKLSSSRASSRQLKLRTYDISKIITELNKLNDDIDKSESVVTKSDKTGAKNTNNVAGVKAVNGAEQNSKRCAEKDIKLCVASAGGERAAAVSNGSGDTSPDTCGHQGRASNKQTLAAGR